MNNYNSDDGARRAIELGLELMCYKALNEIEVIFGCIADMKANFALSPTRIQQVYDYMDLPKDPFEFIDTVPEDSPEVTTMRRNLRVILDEFPTFDAYDFWFTPRGTPACRGNFGDRRKAVRERFALQGGRTITGLAKNIRCLGSNLDLTNG